MDKKELIIFGLLALVAVLLLYTFAWPKEQQIVIVEQPAAQIIIPERIPVVEPEVLMPVPEAEPQPMPEAAPEPVPEITPPAQEDEGLVFTNGQAIMQTQVPTKENLIPAYIEYQINKLIIPEYMAYPFIPVKKDNIRTFAGSFGPYYHDYRPYIYVELCSFITSQPEMFACEKVDLNYINNYLTFVRGYKPDEFIGNVAMKDFGSYYLIRSKEHGILAKSNIGSVKLVTN